MRIADIFPGEAAQLPEAAGEREVDALCFDSRQASPNSVFFALPGQKSDGAHFAREAADRGAMAVVSSRPLGMEGVVDIVVENPRSAMADAAAAFYGNPSRRLKVYGITGTNGKTTTAFLIRHLCEASSTPCGLLGTVEYRIGDEVLPAPHTTPESIDLQGLLRRMSDAGCDAAAMEISSHALIQDRVRGIVLEAAVFTNLTQDHLDYHGTMEKYFEAKALLFSALEAQTGKRGKAILPLEDRFGARLIDRFRSSLSVITYGLGGACDFQASNLQFSPTGTTFQLTAKGRQMLVRLPLIGRYNVSNALAALAACVGTGLDLRGCVQALADAPQVPGRLERVQMKRNFQVFVDYAHTPDALENVLAALRDLRPARLIVVFGCGGDRDRAKRPLMGRAVELQADQIIVTSDNPRTEDPELILRDVTRGMTGRKHQVVVDRSEAIEMAVQMAQAGDIVLIAGKGHEDYQELAHGRIPFSDVAAATGAIRRKRVEMEA